MKPIIREISSDIQIGNDWLEIHPTPPLSVEKKIQRISIDIPDLANWNIMPEHGSFIMPNGTEIKIEVELISENGYRFTLGSVGLGPGLTFSYLPKEQNPATSRFPTNMTFNAVRFRSSHPITVTRVTWICITNY